ncbi:alpha/beta fold hydrolase [Sphingobium xenophagum]
MSDGKREYRSVWTYLMDVPFKQDYIEVEGFRTRYLEAGRLEAPPLVLLHGTGGHWEAFCANIGPLSQHFRVLALDMLGCGFTDKPDRPYETWTYAAHVLAFMDKMSIEKASFIGVSLGAWVSVRIALENPERVERVVLVAPTGYFPMPAAALQTTSVRSSITGPPTWDQAARVISQLLYNPEKTLMDDIVAVRKHVYSCSDIGKIMPRMLTLLNPEARARNNLSDDQWCSLKQPMLLIENVDHDDIFLKTARKVSKLLPNGRLVPVREVAHWAQLEAPDTFNKLAIAFLEGAELGDP